MTYDQLMSAIPAHTNNLIEEVKFEANKFKYVDNMGPLERRICRQKIMFCVFLEMFSIWKPFEIATNILLHFRDSKKRFLCSCCTTLSNEHGILLHRRTAHTFIDELMVEFHRMHYNGGDLTRIMDLDFSKLGDTSNRSPLLGPI